MKRTSQNNFSGSLLDWYGASSRKLPWRASKDPYKIWISEIMLQQTTVNTVIPYFERWVKEFPNLNHVVDAPLERILRMWQGLGYYTRARNIKKAAHILVEKYEGRIPQDPEELKNLPGFGPYTRGAVLSIAYDKRLPIIDANVRRVVMRLLALEGYADPSQDKEILKFLEAHLPHKNVGDFNQALMELGAMICRSREPSCLICPVRVRCKARLNNLQDVIPLVKKEAKKELQVAVAVIKKGNKFFIQKRPSKGLLGDLWEFPGGKIEKGETALSALKREIREELDIGISNIKFLMHVKHFYTQFKVNLHVFTAEPSDLIKINAVRRWVTLKNIENYPMPSGNVRIVEALRKK